MRILVTVRDVLMLPSLAGAEVVAGTSGLDRPVRWIHVSELLDIARLLGGGEFLLTTGMKLKDADPEQQHAYVRSLVDVGVAALGIELVQWLSEPPPVVVEVCNSEGLPLIAWRTEVRFSAITEEVSRLLLDHGSGRLPPDDADLAEEILSGKAIEPLWRARLELAGLELGKWLGVVALEIVRPDGEDDSACRTVLVGALRGAVPAARHGLASARTARLVLSGRGRLIKVILTGPSADLLVADCHHLAGQLRRALARSFPGSRLRMGVGRPRSNPGELAEAWREAVTVIRFQAGSGQEEYIHFNEIRLGRFLLAAPPPVLRQLVQEELSHLLALPAPERDELLRTLNALLEENFNISAAAKRLHIRRQSLYRRMERLQALLGPDLDRCDRRTALYLALRAKDLVGVIDAHRR